MNTDTGKDELVRIFGQRVADLVAAESENKREDQPAEETWWIRKQETIEHLSKASTEVKMIALGDTGLEDAAEGPEGLLRFLNEVRKERPC